MLTFTLTGKLRLPGFVPVPTGTEVFIRVATGTVSDVDNDVVYTHEDSTVTDAIGAFTLTGLPRGSGVFYRLWSADPNLLPAFIFAAPDTATVDLSDLIPVTTSPVAVSKGETGASAYEVAVANGYTGTEAEWVASLGGVAGSTAPPATTLVKGIVKLAGDLGGTADLPTVPGLADKASTTDPRFTDARTPTAHAHDDLYFTEAEVTAALAGKASTTDPRFTDARTPTAHAHTTADVTGLDTALTGKAPTVHTHTAAQLSDSTVTGRSVVTAIDAAAARTAIGAGTSSLAIGTTAGTAKVGTYVPTWTEVTSKPTTFAPIIGATAATAVAGNDARLTDARTPTAHSHAIADVTGALATADAPELIRDTMGTALVAGSNVTITPSDAGDTITIAATAGGGVASPYVSLGLSADAAYGGSSITSVNWTQEVSDTHGFHDLAVDTNRITVPAGLGGLYQLSWTIDGVPVGIVYKNGAAIYDGGATGVAILPLVDGDYVSVSLYNTAAGTVRRAGGSGGLTTHAELIRLSD